MQNNERHTQKSYSKWYFVCKIRARAIIAACILRISRNQVRQWVCIQCSAMFSMCNSHLLHAGEMLRMNAEVWWNDGFGLPVLTLTYDKYEIISLAHLISIHSVCALASYRSGCFFFSLLALSHSAPPVRRVCVLFSLLFIPNKWLRALKVCLVCLFCGYCVFFRLIFNAKPFYSFLYLFCLPDLVFALLCFHLMFHCVRQHFSFPTPPHSMPHESTHFKLVAQQTATYMQIINTQKNVCHRTMYAFLNW